MGQEEYTLTQKAIVEFLGTFSIVFIGAGAVVVDLMTAPPDAGTEFVLDGLGMGTLGWVGIALAFWGAVAIPIYLFGHVSGQHINPAVTIGFLVLRRIDGKSATVYIVAQLAGAIVAGVLFTLIRGPEAVEIASMGATAPFPGVEQWQAALSEGVITFFLMLTVVAMAVDERTPDSFAGLAIGGIVAVGVLTTGNITGGSFNPARTLGPYVTTTAFGGESLWAHAWIYVVAPTAGAIAGAITYDRVVLRPHVGSEPDASDVAPADD